jgi:3-dehydroquinate synthase
VQQDPIEKGLRKILNAGHTIGHAIETSYLASGQPILHGEAVAAGLICESRIAFQKNLINANEVEEITSYLLTTFGHLKLPAPHREIANWCYQDKKNTGNKVMMALINSIGRARWDVDVTTDEIVDSLTYYGSLHT